jgi:hypothetical protein
MWVASGGGSPGRSRKWSGGRFGNGKEEQGVIDRDMRQFIFFPFLSGQLKLS